MPRPSLLDLARIARRVSQHPAHLRCASVDLPRALVVARLPPSRMRYSTAGERERAKSLDRYYNDIVMHPHKAPPTRTGPASQQGEPLPKTEREATIAKARVVFGSRLAGPADRRRELDNASIRIAGVLVPPRPEEPDNCCMSGCVNCVWDRYRDELEEWAEKSAQARMALQAQRGEERRQRMRSRGSNPASEAGQQDMPMHVASSMDDDGGGSEALWTGTDGDHFLGAGGNKSEDLFAGVPVGIREFMRTEKKLREKKQNAKLKS